VSADFNYGNKKGKKEKKILGSAASKRGLKIWRQKREYETNENNETNEKYPLFRLFRYSRLFRILSFCQQRAFQGLIP
jgi:hypothetical protein